MLALLEQLFQEVRSYLHAERFDASQVYMQSPEHVTMRFDREAEDLIIEGLRASGSDFEVVTEERPTFSTGPAPTYRIVIDPVDGSTNVSRGIATAAVSLAVLPIDAPISPPNVQWALVGELFSGTVYRAERGKGAFRDGRPCSTSSETRLNRCIAGMNFDGRDLETLRRLLTVRPTPGKMRRCGSAAMDIVYVASGAYDAYIDIGKILTAESFLAALSIVLEAGGVVSDEHGKPLNPARDLRETFSLVAAGTRELQQEILTKIKG